jgi:hypothetical protein
MADKDGSDSVVVSQVDQIGEIFSDYAPVAAEPAKVEPVVADPVKPAEPAKPAEPVKPVEPAVVEPVKDEKDVAIATLTDQVKTLIDQVKALSAAKPAEPVKPAEPAKPADTAFSLGFFKDRAEYEAAFEKPEVMAEVMGRVSTHAVQTILKTLPQVINNTIKAQMEVQTLASAFYKDNDDLKDNKEFVGYVSNDLSGKNPDWTLAKLFEELPKEVRKRIGLKEAVVQPVKGPAQPPKKGGARTPQEPAPVETALEKEIADLI